MTTHRVVIRVIEPTGHVLRLVSPPISLGSARAWKRTCVDETGSDMDGSRTGVDIEPVQEDLDEVNDAIQWADKLAEAIFDLLGVKVNPVHPWARALEAAKEALALPHVIELTNTSWQLQHPLSCRPNLHACPVNRYSVDRDVWGRVEPGRYECGVEDDVLVVGKRLQAS